MIRTIYCEQQIDQRGNLKTSAVDWLDTKGMSVDRLLYREMTALQDTVERKVAASRSMGKKRDFKGVLVFCVRDIRRIIIDGKRLFGIYDTATAENTAHADIAWAYPIRGADRSEARDKLLGVLGDCPRPLSLEDAYASEKTT